jgi:hypothetical protein
MAPRVASPRASTTAGFTRQRSASTSRSDTRVYGDGCRPCSSTSQIAWNTCIAWCVSRLGTICVIVARLRYTNSQRRRLSSTAPVPERPATKSSKSGMQNVFWTSTARRQTRNESSTATPTAWISAHASASRARSSYGTRQTAPTRPGSKWGGNGSSRTTGIMTRLTARRGRRVSSLSDRRRRVGGSAANRDRGTRSPDARRAVASPGTSGSSPTSTPIARVPRCARWRTSGPSPQPTSTTTGARRRAGAHRGRRAATGSGRARRETAWRAARRDIAGGRARRRAAAGGRRISAGRVRAGRPRSGAPDVAQLVHDGPERQRLGGDRPAHRLWPSRRTEKRALAARVTASRTKSHGSGRTAILRGPAGRTHGRRNPDPSAAGVGSRRRLALAGCSTALVPPRRCGGRFHHAVAWP